MKRVKRKRSNKKYLDIGSTLKRAIQFHGKGRFGEAEKLCREILRADPDSAAVLNYLGLMADRKGDTDSALDLLGRALAACPGNPEYRTNLAMILEHAEQFEKAVECYEQVIAENADDLPVCLKLATLLASLDREKEAVDLCVKVLRRDPESVQACYQLGIIMQKRLKFREAFTFLQKTIVLKPDHIPAILALAALYQFTGKIEESKSVLNNLLSCRPGCVHAYYALADIEDFKEDDPAFTILESLKSKKDIPVGDKIQACFALGKMYARVKNYDSAFAGYSEGNRLREKQEEPYDRGKIEKLVETYARIVTTELFSKKKGYGLDTERPIFIVGMPRSGTTLLEQIISSHSEAFGAGELRHISRICGRLVDPKNLEKSVLCLEREKIREAAAYYVRVIEDMAPDARRVTDKMPSNLLNVWLIHLMFPRARILYCKRNPVDTCLSCYFQNFVSGHPYSSNLQALGHYYNQSARLMQHWLDVVPTAILTVEYESMVENPGRIVSEVLAFCGLGWEDNCLEYHESDRSVITASRTQVRKQIYKTSVGKWQNYERHLAPLLESLGKMAE